MAQLVPPSLSLYIHLPWCLRKCPYCDFNSHASLGRLPEKRYVDALLADLNQDLPWADNRPLSSIFFGGGTPSLFSPTSFGRLLDGIRSRTLWEEDIEITLEANPGTMEGEKLKEFRALGINRLSLGIQSFQDPKLRTLGRIHSARESILAVEAARAAGFTNLNLDLMFGLPGQSLKDAVHDITTAISLEPTHISFYQLTLEPNTLFAKYPPVLPDGDRIWAIQNVCQEKLAAAGFNRYEISAYARAEHHCRHNLNYWRFGDYLGIGAGAHGKITDAGGGRVLRTWKIRHPHHYMEKSATPGRLGGRQAVTETERPLEFLLNTLRLREGFTPGQFEQRTGLPFDRIAFILRQLIDDGLLQHRGERVACSKRGWNFLDSILELFVPP